LEKTGKEQMSHMEGGDASKTARQHPLDVAPNRFDKIDRPTPSGLKALVAAGEAIVADVLTVGFNNRC